MDANYFTPNDNSAGKVKQAEVISSFLLEANQKLAETIEKRMRNLYNPTPSFIGGVLLNFFLFLTA